jgi:hypothetical protein
MVNRIDLGSRKATKDYVQNVFDRVYADLDETMESLSPSEPSEEILQHRRRNISDSETIARAREELLTVSGEEALARNAFGKSSGTAALCRWCSISISRR